MKFKEVKDALKKIGMTITYKSEYSEYRVNFISGKEETAYYTNDLDDAYLTGQDMAKRGNK
jgi:hypothetical protein